MYTGIKLILIIPGINNRDDLIQTIYQMTDDGHANDLAGLYLMASLFPEEWKALMLVARRRVDLYPIRCPNRYVLWRRGIKARLCSNGVSVTGRCAQQLADGRREFMAAIARLCTSSPLLSQLDALFFRLFVRTSYWQSSQCEDNTSLREALTLYKYDSAGSRMFGRAGEKRSFLCHASPAAINCPA